MHFWQSNPLGKRDSTEHRTVYQIGALQIPVEHLRMAAYYLCFSSSNVMNLSSGKMVHDIKKKTKTKKQLIPTEAV